MTDPIEDIITRITDSLRRSYDDDVENIKPWRDYAEAIVVDLGLNHVGWYSQNYGGNAPTYAEAWDWDTNEDGTLRKPIYATSRDKD